MVEFHNTLLNLYRKNVVMMTAQQMAFGRYIAQADSCNVDLDQCRIFFGDSISYTVSLLGTDDGDLWTWSWAQDAYKDSAVIKAAQKMRKLGVKQQMQILSDKHFDLDAEANGYNMSILGSVMAQADCMYTLEVGAGSRAFLLLYKDGGDAFDGTYTQEDVLEAFRMTVYESEHASIDGLRQACDSAGFVNYMEDGCVYLADHTVRFDRSGQCLGIERGIVRPLIAERDRRTEVDSVEGVTVAVTAAIESDDPSGSKTEPLQIIERIVVDEQIVNAGSNADPRGGQKESGTRSRARRRKSSARGGARRRR